jgi:hypothetical protein
LDQGMKAYSGGGIITNLTFQCIIFESVWEQGGKENIFTQELWRILQSEKFHSYVIYMHVRLRPQMEVGRFPRVQSGQAAKLSTHSHQVARWRMVELYIHSSICIHGILFH